MIILNKQIHRVIQKEYEEKQKKVKDILDARKEQVYNKIPKCLEIEKDIKLLGIKYNRMILENKAEYDTLYELENKINKLKGFKNKLLNDNGFDEKFLSSNYECQQCFDTGFIRTNEITEKCGCYKQKLVNYLYKNSNLNMLESENFEKFNENIFDDTVSKEMYEIDISPRENINNIKKLCLKFIKNFSSNDSKNLFFTGTTGVGKTFMSSAIAKEILDKGFTVLYLSAPNLFDIINQYRFNNYKSSDNNYANYENVLEVDLLIIDDLGIETKSSAKYSEFLNILNSRRSSNNKRPCKTIISSNIGIKEIRDIYSERVVSRIIGDFEIIWFAGKDLRRIVRNK